jgi:hypothetical protein
MVFHDKNRVPLFKALEANGWFWEGDRLYSPHKSMWFEGDDSLSVNQVANYYEQKRSELERMVQLKHLYPDRKRFQEWFRDTENLVSILKELVEGNKTS